MIGEYFTSISSFTVRSPGPGRSTLLQLWARKPRVIEAQGTTPLTCETIIVNLSAA
jgi:hypothetical protein